MIKTQYIEEARNISLDVW